MTRFACGSTPPWVPDLGSGKDGWRAERRWNGGRVLARVVRPPGFRPVSGYGVTFLRRHDGGVLVLGDDGCFPRPSPGYRLGGRNDGGGVMGVFGSGARMTVVAVGPRSGSWDDGGGRPGMTVRWEGVSRPTTSTPLPQVLRRGLLRTTLPSQFAGGANTLPRSREA